MEKILPTINIEGTEFIIDATAEELSEKADPKNIIAFKDMFYLGNGYQFHYDTAAKNLARLESGLSFRDDGTVKKITIPNLTDMDPSGMAERYSTTVDKIKGKTDFELAIEPGSLLDLRWNQKKLPILKIAGHPFFVDIPAGRLRPKDDFKSKGISLDQINSYYDRLAHAYIFPYNPKTHEFQEIDHLSITQLPEDIIVVKFPHLQLLDRVGWNVKYGFAPFYCIRDKEFKMQFKAQTLPWAQTNIPDSIKQNLEQKQMHQENAAPRIKLPPQPLKKNKRRKL